MTYSERFLDFWRQYACPRRVKKPAAYAAWVKGGCEDAHADVMEGLARFKATQQWAEGFMPEPERFLRHRRWEDEPVESEAQDDAGWSPTGPPKGGV